MNLRRPALGLGMRRQAGLPGKDLEDGLDSHFTFSSTSGRKFQKEFLGKRCELLAKVGIL